MIISTLLLALLMGVQSPERTLVNNLLVAQTERCWTLDRLSNKDVVSCAATGVGFYAYAKAAKLGIISKETASAWIRAGFDSMINLYPENRGWLYHFVDRRGNVTLSSEISSIDTVIFYAGAEKAAKLLGDDSLLNHILEDKSKIDLFVMMDKDGCFYHSFKYEKGKLIQSRWKWASYNEGILIYKYFNKKFTPTHIDYSLPLFVYYYPTAFYPERSWIEHLGKAIDFQLSMTGRFGYSAMDGMDGYVVNNPYYVSPLAVYSCNRFFSDKVRKQLCDFSVDKLTPSISVNGKWASSDRVLLDDGVALMLISE